MKSDQEKELYFGTLSRKSIFDFHRLSNLQPLTTFDLNFEMKI